MGRAQERRAGGVWQCVCVCLHPADQVFAQREAGGRDSPISPLVGGMLWVHTAERLRIGVCQENRNFWANKRVCIHYKATPVNSRVCIHQGCSSK